MPAGSSHQAVGASTRTGTNLMANPDRASIELPGRDAIAVTQHQLDGADREQAWQRIAAAQPRIAKYQSKCDRE